jgi:UDP-glucose 4-epimerase
MGKVLVTGGAGYIGAHTAVELTAAGLAPVIIDDLSRGSMRLVNGIRKITGKDIPFYKADCKQASELDPIFKQHGDIDTVIHFAALKSVKESVDQPLAYYRNNIDSLITLIEVMSKYKVRNIVFSSSCTVYGQPDQIPVTEDAPFKRAESPYGASKQMCERILMDAAAADKDLQVVSLRYFNPIGAHPSGEIGELPNGVPDNLVPFITQTGIGKRKSLTVFGGDYNTPDGSCLRDFIHVVDLAKAHVAAVKALDTLKSRFEPINLGTGTPCSVLELINAFTKVNGVKIPYEMGPRRKGDIEKVYADPTKSTTLLNWRPQQTMEDALRDAWNWEQKLAHASY